MLTRKSILNALGSPTWLSIEQGEGYIYLVYDNTLEGLYETHSVYVPRLNDLSLDEWACEWRIFQEDMKMYSSKACFLVGGM